MTHFRTDHLRFLVLGALFSDDCSVQLCTVGYGTVWRPLRVDVVIPTNTGSATSHTDSTPSLKVGSIRINHHQVLLIGHRPRYLIFATVLTTMEQRFARFCRPTNILSFVTFIMWLSYRPHYTTWPSVSLSVWRVHIYHNSKKKCIEENKICIWSVIAFSYLRQGGNVFARLCLSVCLCVSKITQKVMDGSFWNFEDMSGMAQTTSDSILGMIRKES